MKTLPTLFILGLGLSAQALRAQTDTPGGPPPAPPAAASKPAPTIHVLPPGAAKRLNLTADQQKQLAAIEAEVAAEIEKVLTPAQLEQLKQMRPPHRRPGSEGPPDGPPDGEGPPPGR